MSIDYLDKIKTCENLVEEFFEQLETLLTSALMEKQTDILSHIYKIKALIKTYKPFLVK